MLAPEKDADNNHFYTLFLEIEKSKVPPGLAEGLELELEKNYHYKLCRKLGQLSGLRLFMINPNSDGRSGLETYFGVCRSFGQKIGNIKPSVLHSKIGWSKEFDGSFIF